MLALACIAVLLLHARGPVPLADNDTTRMLAELRARANPWSWFVTDWPLHNSFYRPITALSFMLDLGIFANMKDGYGLSAAIYCALCIAGVFWLARELTDSPAISSGAAALFAVWQTPLEIHWEWICAALAIVVALAGLARHRFHIKSWLPAALATAYIAMELIGIHRRESPSGFYAGVLLWLPSRTATVMTLFALCTLAAYARYLRTSSIRTEGAPTAIELPATRTSFETPSQKGGWLWIVASGISLLLALGSYEQAITIPLLLLLMAVKFKLDGYQIKWGIQAVFVCELILYLAVRNAVLPGLQSDYIGQQTRTGITAILSVATYVLPSAASLPIWYSGLAVGLPVLLIGSFYSLPIRLAGNLAAFGGALKGSIAPLILWISSCVAFLPMAFLKPFAHYQYFAMSLRSIFAVLMVGVVGRMIVTAVSHRALQAPQRSAPAPGSLHHR